MRKLLIALVLFPALALAEAAPREKAAVGGPAGPDPQQVEKRMRLARTLGLAEALDLEPAQALKLGEAMARFDDRRKVAQQQAHDAADVLRAAARSDKAAAGEVDGAIAKLLDARTQLAAIDKESLTLITRDLSPEKKARAALFLGKFRERIERHAMRGGPGMGMGGGTGPGMGPGMGPGPGMNGGSCGSCPRMGGARGDAGKADCPMDGPGHTGPGMHHQGKMGGPQGSLMLRGQGSPFASRMPGAAADDSGYSDLPSLAYDED
jgi:hypothetical protein